MSKKVRFPLKMANDTQVRTIEELREHFDLAAVLGYYANGRLVEWLSDRYYEDEAKKINALDSSAIDFKIQLCDILGVSYADDEAVDLADISAKNERYARLKMFTADDKILAAVDRVAFSQEDLADLLDDDVNEIYLCGERFKIPGSKECVTYIGVNNPQVETPDGYIGKGIVFVNVSLDIDGIILSAKNATDPIEAVNLWRVAAERGNAEAQFELGVSYDFGEGIEKDAQSAVKWYRKAAEQGYAEAQYNIGICYLDGDGVEENDEEAIKWFLKAAEQGMASSQHEVGFAYMDGLSVEQNREEAIKWFRKAAEQGEANSQNSLGRAYWEGRGVEQNDEEAVKWYRKAADSGSLEAHYNLGLCYSQGVEENDEEAIKWFRKAAEAGHIEAMQQLASMYSMGRGVEEDSEESKKWNWKAVLQQYKDVTTEDIMQRARDEETDTNEAAKLWLIAAERGNAEAQFQRGERFYVDFLRIQGFDEKAKWYLKAAEQGHVEAQYKFSVAVDHCEMNDIEHGYDWEDVIKWLRKAAEADHAEAQYRLGKYYEETDLPVRDYAEAAMWYHAAKSNGHEYADNAISLMRSEGKI